MRPAPRAPRREPTPVQRPNGRVLVRPGALCHGRSPDDAGLVRSSPGLHRSAVPKRSADDLSAGCCQPRCYPLLKALLGILLGISGGAYDLAVTTSRILPLTWGNPRAREGNRTLDLRITSASLCRLSYSGLCSLVAGTSLVAAVKSTAVRELAGRLLGNHRQGRGREG